MRRSTCYTTVAVLIAGTLFWMLIYHWHKKEGPPSDTIAEEQSPQFEVTLPPDLPEVIVLVDKEGNRKTANAKDLYLRAYRQGWDEYWQLYRQGMVDLNDKRALPSPITEFGIEARARLDGFRRCRIAIITGLSRKE